MAKPSVAIRLGTEGKSSVKADFAEVGTSGDAAAKRLGDSFEREAQRLDRARQNMAANAMKIAAIVPKTSTQMLVENMSGTNLGYQGGGGRLPNAEGSARASAMAIEQQLRAQEQLEARTRAFLAVLDPVNAAQQRYNNEMREARALVAAGTITLDQYCAKLRQEQSLLDAATGAQRRSTIASGAHRAAYQQLGFQIQDITQQFALGTPAMIIFAQQGGQVASALSGLGGVVGRVASFIAGPWGAAIMGGTMLIAAMTGGMEYASKAAKEKKNSLEDLIKAIDDLDKATKRQIMSSQAAAQAAYQEALDTYSLAEQKRGLARAQLLVAQSNLASAQTRMMDPTLAGEGGFNGGAVAAAGYAEEVRKLTALLAVLERESNKNATAVTRLKAGMLQQQVKEQYDKSAAITGRYDRALDQLNERFVAGKIVESEYMAELGKLTATRDADTKALQESEKKTRGKTEAEREAAKEKREAIRLEKEHTADLKDLEKAFDPLEAAARKYREQLVEINKLLKAGRLDADTAEDYRMRARAIKFGASIGVDGLRKDGEEEDRKRVARDQAIDRMLWNQRDELEMLDAEAGLLGKNDRIRGETLAKLRLMQDLRRDNIDLESEEGKAILANHARIEEKNRIIASQARDWAEAQRIGENFIDTVLDPRNWDDWGDLGKRVLKDLMAEMMLLAAINPLKNMLFGTELPTMGGVFGSVRGRGSGGNSYMEGDGGLLGFMKGFGFAAGTHYFTGGMATVGENGPENVLLPRGSRIMTAADTRRMMGNDGGISISMPISIDATGADAAGLARVEQKLDMLRAELPSQILSTVNDGRQRGFIR